jgi:hypothetical protein
LTTLKIDKTNNNMNLLTVKYTLFAILLTVLVAIGLVCDIPFYHLVIPIGAWLMIKLGHIVYLFSSDNIDNWADSLIDNANKIKDMYANVKNFWSGF